MFQKLFYSHEIGERKPDVASFERVLDVTGFEAEKTVLFDDLKENLEAAGKLGIKMEYVERNKLRREQLIDGNQ
jgi:putative hydrolase of the HAD superfamily